MDLQTIIAAGLEDKLKCFSCHNYLSYFPISTCSNNQSICGRCEPPDGVICFEDEAFEALSQCLQFPCRYKSEGCCEEFLPKDIHQHEKTCRYRAVPCIVKNQTQCPWTGSLPLLSSHCQEKHSDLIVKNGKFELDLSVSKETEHLMSHDGYFLLFNRKFDCKSKILRASLYYYDENKSSESRTVQLKICNGSTTVSSNFKSTNLNSFMLVKVGLKSLIYKKNSIVLGQILTLKEEVVPVTQSILLSEQANQELLSLLKCVQCFQTTVPPIFRCDQYTKPVCKVCIDSHIAECVACSTRKTDKSTTYPELEKIAKMVLHPCMHQTQGCSVKLNWNEVSTHNVNCQYRNDVCPMRNTLSCKWSGLKMQIIEHILSDHHDFVWSSPFEATLHVDVVYHDVVKFSDFLFRVVYLTQDCNKKYVWSVQTIGDYAKEFMYELEIFDGTDCGQRLLKRQKCSRFTAEDDIFAENGNHCYFEDDQVIGFRINEKGDLNFKIRIFKV